MICRCIIRDPLNLELTFKTLTLVLSTLTSSFVYCMVFFCRIGPVGISNKLGYIRTTITVLIVNVGESEYFHGLNTLFNISVTINSDRRLKREKGRSSFLVNFIQIFYDYSSLLVNLFDWTVNKPYTESFSILTPVLLIIPPRSVPPNAEI